MPAGQVGLILKPDHHVQVSLMTQHGSIPPGGSTLIGVQFDIEDGWHIYADPPGDAGLATRVTWSVPGGISMGPLRWPSHTQFTEAGKIRTFGYTGTALLASELSYHAWRDLYSTITVQAQVQWLACKDICVPESATIQLVLPVSTGPQVPTPQAPLFEARTQ